MPENCSQIAAKTELTCKTPPETSASPVAWGSILCADALTAAASVTPATLDLIYMDPPFFTNKNHSGELRRTGKNHPLSPGSGADALVSRRAVPPAFTLAFDDRWAQGGAHDEGGGRTGYLAWLEARIRALRPLLKPSGTLLLHLDWHVVHHAKVLCDTIFGSNRFENELIWYYQTGGASKGRFSRKHDTILLYSNGPNFFFDGRAIAIPRTAKAMKRAQCPTGARIKATDTHKNPDDVLLIPALNPMAAERTGYPTQKPVELLERLIRALVPPGRPGTDAGAVGDFFCGSGTTLVAAQRLGRRWIGCDTNPAAVELARKRVAKAASIFDSHQRPPAV